jgi:hypothetical protein
MPKFTVPASRIIKVVQIGAIEIEAIDRDSAIAALSKGEGSFVPDDYEPLGDAIETETPIAYGNIRSELMEV